MGHRRAHHHVFDNNPVVSLVFLAFGIRRPGLRWLSLPWPLRQVARRGAGSDEKELV
ncbi:hypothetical protein MM2B1231_1824 [Mycobacteroides abscessus subsp. bolletii 2B-1231]|uniref:Uncharacterized protein n=1 Tax=Mycobacteroides abscessus MAB_091912_2446 TaxID=1335414 RepID=A0A829MAR8_9MYCO|nr:hypothetical protein MM2B0626_1759 [Mycobacteroides abscessus subsp. bolletii 2B-0626]EIV24077.1 hypothetical protein MM2B0912S_1766 [Mycobacteroides abscessus subsp. bolletii 2B-0912-S]EIV77343.1 hypothetical protein MM2B1231_1824 [Mycobacteroides abscessus subsp. bolletii 2B-1231]ESV63075.1 hypothetical protein L833_0449 [Mycobacteroides abscessus MAB_091912_2446]ETZ76619.1 hypothetical protein L831_1775 [Mycobacteroides abscessus MAB_082312_2272]ETZ81479.1 hypothetical protein L834_1700 